MSIEGLSRASRFTWVFCCYKMAYIGLIIANFGPMRKAEFITFENKKEAQLKEDAALGPEGRFRKMFMLISISLFLSPVKQLKIFTDDRFIELKRKAT